MRNPDPSLNISEHSTMVLINLFRSQGTHDNVFKKKSQKLFDCKVKNYQYSFIVIFLILAGQIFYRSYINRQHFRLRSLALYRKTKS